MKKFLLAFLMITSTGLYAQTWNYQWASSFGSPADEDDHVLVGVDGNDNTFVAGQVKGSVSLGGETYPAPDSDGLDIVVAKYSPNGDLLWSGHIAGDGGAGNVTFGDLVEALHVDQNGDVIIAGNLGTSASIFGNALGNDGNRNFVTKIGGDGSVLWTVVADADFGGDRFLEVATNSNNDVFVAGLSGPSGTAWYGIGGVLLNGANTFTDNNEPVVAKISSSGDVEWVKFLHESTPNQLTFDSSDNLIVASRIADGAESGFYLTKYEAESLDIIWTRYASNNNDDPRSRNLGLHVKADDGIVQFVKASNNLDFGDGFASGAGLYSSMGIMIEISAAGETTAIHDMNSLITNAVQVSTTDLSFSPQAFVGIDDESFLIGGNIFGDLETSGGDVISPDPWFAAPVSYPKDVVVLKVSTDLTLDSYATQTGTGPQRTTSMDVFQNGDAAVGGIFENPSVAIFTGNTQFGDTPLTSAGEADYFVTRVTPGEGGPVSVRDFTKEKDLNIFPNPTSDFVNVQYSNEVGESGFIQISDATGKRVMYVPFSGSAQLTQEIDISNLEAGVYILSLVTDSTVLTESVIVQ